MGSLDALFHQSTYSSTLKSGTGPLGHFCIYHVRSLIHVLKYAILRLGEGVVRNVVGSAVRSGSSWIGVGLKTQVVCRKGHQGYPTGAASQ